MKKIGRFIQKILGFIIILLILGTICIFVYPQIKDKTEVDDKVVAFLTERAPSAEEGGEVGTEGTSDSVSGNSVSENTIIVETVLPSEEVEVVYKDDSRAQTWSDEDKRALKSAYNMVLRMMGLSSDNLLFYEMKQIDNEEYYSFQVVDDFGGAYEDLLLYHAADNSVYWDNAKGNLVRAYSTDPIFSGKVPGIKEVDYEDNSWEKVLNGYMDAMLKDRDGDKASTYVDSSCYYLANLPEYQRNSFVDATIDNQRELIEEIQAIEDRKTSKKLDSYSCDYEIYDKEKYIDEYDMDWVDAYIVVDIDTSKNGEKEAYSGYYCVHLREYEYGWRVAAFTKE